MEDGGEYVSDVEEEEVSRGEDGQDTSYSKLRNNIATKGANSYYYAHAKKLDAPVVRSEPPQLVSDASKAERPNTRLYVPFDKFAWVNEKKHVKVYVTFAQAHLVPEDKIELVLNGRDLQFKVIDPNTSQVFALVLAKLKEDVDSVHVHKNRDGDKFRLVLKKKDEDKTWYKLQE